MFGMLFPLRADGFTEPRRIRRTPRHPEVAAKRHLRRTRPPPRSPRAGAIPRARATVRRVIWADRVLFRHHAARLRGTVFTTRLGIVPPPRHHGACLRGAVFPAVQRETIRRARMPQTPSHPDKPGGDVSRGLATRAELVSGRSSCQLGLEPRAHLATAAGPATRSDCRPADPVARTLLFQVGRTRPEHQRRDIPEPV